MRLMIGCGKMGGAILDGWIASGVTDNVVLARNADSAKLIEKKYNTKTITSLDELDEVPKVIVCAVKPYQIEQVLAQLKKLDKLTLISVVVGKSIECISNIVGKQHLIVRAMPNITCLVKSGVIGAYSATKNKEAEELLSSVGEVFWLKNENEIEVTAGLSGGAPAFLIKMLDVYSHEVAGINSLDVEEVKLRTMNVFRAQQKLSVIDQVINGWINDAVLLGLDSSVAIQMMLRSIVGTVKLLDNMSGDEIITAVASKKGTTEAGMLALEHGLSPVVAAYRRAKEISAKG